LRLSRFFGVSEAFFIGLQADYDTATAKDALAEELESIEPLSMGEAQPA
jgi:plasmid maintenance system antidote protein VapI